MNEPGVRFTVLRHYKEMNSEHFIFLQHSILSSCHLGSVLLRKIIRKAWKITKPLAICFSAESGIEASMHKLHFNPQKVKSKF